jgi:hypothetical protein
MSATVAAPRKPPTGGKSYYAGFFSPAVFDLIAWEQISRVDLEQMPETKAFLCEALAAARSTHRAHGSRDKEVDRGQPRRRFAEIAKAELAINILPRLENLMNCWGISVDEYSDQVQERPLSEEEARRLTRHYQAPLD